MAIPLRPLELFAQQFADFVILSEPFELLQTTFGLQLKISDTKDGRGVITIHDDPSLEHQEDDSLEKTKKPMSHYYRLLPDYQTTFLWYDEYWPRDPPDQSHVDWDVIEERHSTLMPFYNEWVTRYQKAFDQGFDMWVFPNLSTHVAWEVADFFIAWWLVLQNDVICVRYELVSKHYEIKKDNIEEKLREFLIYVNEYSDERRGFDY